MSRNPKGFWRALDLLAGGAVMAEWTQELGDELERAQPLLRLARPGGLAPLHECAGVRGAAPGGGNRAWAVGGGVRPRAFVSAVPAGEEGSVCVRPRHGAALQPHCSGVGLGAVNGRGSPGRCVLSGLGSYGAAGWPVYLMLPGDSARMMREVERLFGTQPDPFAGADADGCSLLA